jgi:hypothetical protein
MVIQESQIQIALPPISSNVRRLASMPAAAAASRLPFFSAVSG